VTAHGEPVPQGSERAASDDPLSPGISVVVPCFNSGPLLEELVQELGAVLPGCHERFEVVLVDDGSKDDTWAVIRRLAAAHPWVRGIHLMRNYGQHNATLCGTRAAIYDVTVTIDDDLQNPPAEIPRLLEKLGEGYDLVYGTARKKAPHSPGRYALSWTMRYAVALAARQRRVREVTCFRAFRTILRRASADYRSPQALLDILLGWGTTHITTTLVEHHPRKVGRSNYGMMELIDQALLLWTGYTTAPLRFASFTGFAFVVFGFFVLIYVFVRYLLQGSMPGFPFLASIITIFGGVQLFTLGIIGEYLARIFTRSLDEPAYVVKEATRGAVSVTPAAAASRGQVEDAGR